MAKLASNCLQAWVARRLGPRAFVHLKDQGKEPRHVTGGQLEEFDFQEWNPWSPPPKCDNSRTEILKRCAAPLKTERSCSFGCQVRLVVLFFWLRLLCWLLSSPSEEEAARLSPASTCRSPTFPEPTSSSVGCSVGTISTCLSSRKRLFF